MKRSLQIIAFFLSLTMLLQVLPVQQIGKMLGQNQCTEELPHANDDCPEKKGGADFLGNPFLPSDAYFIDDNENEIAVRLNYLDFADSIPINHSGEIVLPPPDVM